MKFKTTLTLILIAGIFAMSLPASIYAQQNIDQFWAKFKNAVIKGDKNAVANMTRFPLLMPFGMRLIQTKSAFLKKYNVIFNGEADAAKCFAKSNIVKTEEGRYIVACGFKDSTDERNNPIEYEFIQTKTGWKFSRFDNINE
jgi:hypothetical protein